MPAGSGAGALIALWPLQYRRSIARAREDREPGRRRRAFDERMNRGWIRAALVIARSPEYC